ncbi:MAG: hypothetical protein RL095_3366 [Verrucomicrobiota bacterium]|jgi:diadenosine tetraphosphate (Ap4A) HIT family hydrolase
MFELHPRLAADTFAVAELPLCSVRLMNEAALPWLILVPRRADLREFTDLPQEERHRLMDEICLASEVLQKLFAPDKINVGALGNLVPQLHIHVQARSSADRCWPGPVWGRFPAIPYDDAARLERLAALQEAFAP